MSLSVFVNKVSVNKVNVNKVDIKVNVSKVLHFGGKSMEALVSPINVSWAAWI